MIISHLWLWPDCSGRSHLSIYSPSLEADLVPAVVWLQPRPSPGDRLPACSGPGRAAPGSCTSECRLHFCRCPAPSQLPPKEMQEFHQRLIRFPFFKSCNLFRFAVIMHMNMVPDIFFPLPDVFKTTNLFIERQVDSLQLILELSAQSSCISTDQRLQTNDTKRRRRRLRFMNYMCVCVTLEKKSKYELQTCS